MANVLVLQDVILGVPGSLPSKSDRRAAIGDEHHIAKIRLEKLGARTAPQYCQQLVLIKLGDQRGRDVELLPIF